MVQKTFDVNDVFDIDDIFGELRKRGCSHFQVLGCEHVDEGVYHVVVRFIVKVKGGGNDE